MPMETYENGFTVEYHTESKMRIDLSELAESLQGWAREYDNFCRTQLKSETTSKLLITGVRGNSIDFDFIQNALPIISDTVTIPLGLSAFISIIKDVCEFFKGSSQATKPSKTSTKNVISILSPSTNGSVGNISIKGNNNIIYNITYNDANQITQAGKKFLEETSERKEYLTNKFLRFYQARNARSQKGNKAIIEDISQIPINTTFDSDELKNRILHPDKYNIFDVAFKVDLRVKIKDDKINEYVVEKLHEIISLEPTNELGLEDNLFEDDI